MKRTDSLGAIYDTEHALQNPDPHIRIAAIYHAAKRPELDGSLIESILNAGDPSNTLPTRIGAVALAQRGRTEGLEFLLSKIKSSQGTDREKWEATLRNCTRFPFAVLLDRATFIESVGQVHDARTRSLLEQMIRLTVDDFREMSISGRARARRYVELLIALDQVSGLVCREHTICDRGSIDALPRYDRLGRLRLARVELELYFDANALLNGPCAAIGRQVVVVARPQSGAQRTSWIRLLAQKHWAKAGCPDGRDNEFWSAAERDYEAIEHEECRRLAYYRWLHAGTPSGRGEEFWHEAKRQLSQNSPSHAELVFCLGVVDPDDGFRGLSRS